MRLDEQLQFGAIYMHVGLLGSKNGSAMQCILLDQKCSLGVHGLNLLSLLLHLQSLCWFQSD